MSQFEPARHGDAVHERDRRDRHRAQAPEDPVHVGHEARERHRVALERAVAPEIAASGERPPGAGHEDGAHVAVGLHLVEAAVQRGEHGAVDGVELLGSVQGEQHGDRAAPPQPVPF
jgi:hypothetical protein